MTRAGREIIKSLYQKDQKLIEDTHCILPSLLIQSEKVYEEVDKKREKLKKESNFGTKIERCVLFNSHDRAVN